MDSSIFLNQLFAGLSTASILLMIGVGLAIIYGSMGVINLAHGEFVMLGAYATWALQFYFGLGMLVSLPIVFVAIGAVGWVIEKGIVSRLYNRPLDTILATWGVGIVLQQAITLGIGSQSRFVQRPKMFDGNLLVGDMVISNYRLFIIAVSAAMLGATYLLLTRTEFGTKLRSVIQNREISECYGVRAERIYALTFAYGAALAGVAGALVTPLISTTPTMGTTLVVDAFLVVIVGGVGSLVGTALASVLIGEASAMFSMIFNDTTGRIALLVGIILLIRFRPKGLIPQTVRG
ncbi:urea ABC transporter permease subunit UrtB [Aurantimonas coralicida]|uniref:urea ABC transporter permease subunit UrtB n=1 Tax=Aurantimonas coralicida TaxID=182270 RepID=UPI001E343356|nr:urea ABC transporter permease subunit UrtB [Aurantimonas coralicida]MCD1645334.1 urea ABC transporter permease subunit UrtB [Aurantimonas coralicida]